MVDEKLLKIIAAGKESNLIEILQDIQEEFGYLSKENLTFLSKKLKIPVIEIYGVASFYTAFKLEQEGKYVVRVCRGTACHVKNSKDILEHLERKLGISAGETTKDKKITLEAVYCIGACARAPAVMVNKKVYGNVTRAIADRIIGSLK